MSVKKIFNENNILNIILMFSVAAGAFIRLKGVGTWPLTIDEYYIAKAAKNILEHGIPMWEGGGIYVRGLLQQYITATLYYFGADLESGARVFPVFMNLLAILPLYMLSKKISGKVFATAVVFVFSFSLWEIEMARFARMYAPFQAIFLWYLYFLHKSLIEKDKKSVKWLFILSFTSIFIYEANIFLAVLNFLPVIWNSEKNTIDFSSILKNKSRYLYLAAAIIIFICAYYFRQIDFKTGTPSYPREIIDGIYTMDKTSKFFSEGILKKPFSLLTTLGSSYIWILIFSIAATFTFYSLYKLLKSEERLSFKLSIAFLLLLATCNLFGLMVLSALVFLVLNWIEPSDFKNIYKKPFAFSMLLFFIAWILYCYFSSGWQVSYAGNFTGGSTAKIKNIFMVLFQYPDNYFQGWRYYYVMPYFTLFAFVFSGFGFYKVLGNPAKDTSSIRLLLFTALIIFIMISMLSIPGSTRYSFLIFPIVLIFILFSIYMLAEQFSTRRKYKPAVILLLIIIFLAFSEDFRANHLMNVDSKEINFRMIYNKALEEHYYPRWDIATPAEFVNKNADSDDIIIINEFNLEFHLKDFDYVYVDYKEGRFYNSTLEQGKKERWTNSKLIWNENDLNNILHMKGKEVWFISKDIHSKNISYYHEFKKYLVYKNIDSSFSVYKFNNN